MFCDIAARPKEFAIEPIAVADSANYVCFADRTPGSAVHMLLTPVKHISAYRKLLSDFWTLTSWISECEIVDEGRSRDA